MKDKLHTVILLIALVVAQSRAESQTLMVLYEKARAQDGQFRAAQFALEAALEKRPQALAGLGPAINLTANGNRQNGQTSFDSAPFIDRSLQNWGWTLQLTQPLIRWNNWIAVDVADAQTQQAQAQFTLAHNDLVLRTTQAYFDVVLAQQGTGVAQAQLAAINDQLASAKRGFQIGTGTVTDVHEAQAKYALANSQRLAAQNELEVKAAELARIVGESITLTPAAIEEQMPVDDSRSLSDWLALASTENLNVRLQQAMLMEAQHNVRKYSSQHAPTLDLVANQAVNFSSGSLTSPADIANRAQSQQVGLQLTFPFYAGGATTASVREAVALQEKSRQELIAAKRNASSQIRQAYAGMVNGAAQIDALKVALIASHNAVESNKLGFKIGTRTNTDVLAAEQQLYQTQRDLNKARIETAIQRLRLRAAAGPLQSADVQNLQAILVPL